MSDPFISQPLADRIMAQAFADIRGDVLASYPGPRKRSTASLFNAAGGAAFALYLNRISRHADALVKYDPSPAMSLYILKGLMLECQQRMLKTYKEPHEASLTQIFSRHPGAERTFENFLAYFSRRAYVSTNPYTLAALQEQRASFVL